MNATHVPFFTLSAYLDTGQFRYLLFMVLLCVYAVILAANVLLIVVICVNRSLHEPMYMFLCSLFVNELYGSTGLFPFLLLQILSDVHTVSASLCFLQVFCVYFYGSVEFCNLAVMSYDRYLAICFPLQYSCSMSWRKVAVLVALSWLYPLVVIVALVTLSARLQLCGSVIDKVFCGNYSIVKLACSDTRVNNIYGLLVTALTVVIPFISILFTYVRILQVCFSGSRQTRQKALTTCTPHLASILNFSCGSCFQILQGRFDMSDLPEVLNIFLSLYFLICQPLFNPVMYGLRMSKISAICRALFCVK